MGLRDEFCDDSALADCFKERCWGLHRRAEQAGIMRDLLRGVVEQARYAALLRNLHAIYAELEPALAARGGHPCIAPLPLEGLQRCEALAADLCFLCGPRWSIEIGRAPACERYVARLSHLRDTQPALLLAHAYIRYLGDLRGGQMLARIVRRSFGLPQELGTAFYSFREDADVLAARLRTALNSVPTDAALRGELVEEVRRGFDLHIALFEELSAPRRASIYAASSTQG
jgi:heme oxygenase